jgi:hypothetical protein
MAALTAVSITTAGATPAPVAVAASDTIAATQFGPTGCILRVINAGGTQDSVTITDPNLSVLGNAVTAPTPVVVPITTGVRMIFIPLAAINQATQLATVNHSFTTTVTCELYRA